MADARARKRARHGGGGGATEQVPDELLLEAFARLPGLLDLVRCAATCWRWRHLVTDRAFLRRLGHWPDTARHPSFLAGIFSQNTFPGGSGWRPSKKSEYCYNPPWFLSLQAGGGTRLTFDSFFAFDDDDTLFDLAKPLASRRGFLLVRVLLGGEQRKLHVAVCRPLVDRRSTHLLPPPPFPDNSTIGCAILAGEDGNLDHTQQQQQPFQVIFIYYSDSGIVCACTYFSDTGAWNAPVECYRASEFIMYGPRAGVVSRGGTVHWLVLDKKKLMFYTLNINVATSHISLTEIPIKVDARPPIPCIAGEEGSLLSFVTVRDHGMAELWTKQEQYKDDDEEEHDQECNGVWRCSELADLGSERIDCVFFAESRSALLIGQHGVGFSIVDLKTKKKAPIHLKKKGPGYKRATRRFPVWCTSTCCSGHPHKACGDDSPVLYEMDWVFSHRLSSLASSQLGDQIE